MKKTTITTLQGSRSETTTHKEPGLNEKEIVNGSIQDIDDRSKVQPQVLSENRLKTGESSTDDDVPDGQQENINKEDETMDNDESGYELDNENQ